jgi:glycyl-tRNA synthetase beta chain
MATFVFEIGVEEIPARFLPDLQTGLLSAFSQEFENALIDCAGARAYATPRRLTLLVDSLSLKQREKEELVTGPPQRVAYGPDGQPTKAALGFAKTQGVELSDTFLLETEKGAYLAARKKLGGGETASLLPEMALRVISGLQFPKKMRWGSLDFGFGRPIRWLLCLLDEQVAPFELAGIASGNQTCGHRVMGFGPWTVPNASAYLGVLKDKGKVVLDAQERKALITAQAQALAAEQGGKPVWRASLLDEVAGLVEWPQVVLGRFDPSFLEVPAEVLLTSMESHQKSFGVQDADDKLLPCFLSTLNIVPTDIGLVRKGWERVLKARLEDARFFWRTDNKHDFEQWLAKLETVVFLGPLGSMADKARRLESLCGFLRNELQDQELDELPRAGLLAKADLVSEMVGEFADLQGIMGGIYARRKGESELVAKAIAEQYLPAGPDSPTPGSLAGALLSLADKLDTLVGCFGLNMAPTGANDPYALRRCALGVCRILLEKGLRLDLERLLERAQKGYGERKWKLAPADALEKLREFFAGRLKHFFIGQGFETLAVEAAVAAGFDDVWALARRVEALQAFSREADFQQAVLTFKRAGNIIRKQGLGVEVAGACIDGCFSPEAFEMEEERELAAKLLAASGRFAQLWAADDYASLMGLLRELRPAVDAFFDKVMVMCEDPTLRLNRLNLLKSLVDMLGRLADFNALQV